MKLTRFSRVGAALAVGALLLTACGSDDNTSSDGASGSTTAAAGSDSACAGQKTLKANGSSAQANAMTLFIAAYEAACPGYSLDYTSDGSGAGVLAFTGDQNDFAGSDSPLDPAKGEVDAAAKRCGSEAWDLPVVFGPIAVTYNVKGVDELVLDGPTTAKIFNGGITKWDDSAVAKLNPDVKLPSEKITVLFRSDESGTTDNFQKYLDSAGDGAWGKGTGKVFNGGVGEGAKGNEGTSAAIKSTDGSITYNEWSFATQQGLSIASIVTSAGPDPVEISTDTVGKTIEGAKVKGVGNDLVLDTTSFYKPTVTGAYPIVLATYEIVCSKYSDAETGKAVKSFLTSTIGTGQDGLADAGYIPIPDTFKEKLTTAINAIS